MAAPTLRLSLQSVSKSLLPEVAAASPQCRGFAGVTPKSLKGGAASPFFGVEAESSRFFATEAPTPTSRADQASRTPSAATRLFAAPEDSIVTPSVFEMQKPAAPSALPRLLGRAGPLGTNEVGRSGGCPRLPDPASERQLATSARDAFLARQGRISSRGQRLWDGDACE